MFEAAIDRLVELLQADQGDGGTLDGIKLVRFGDLNPIPTLQHPAVTVDWVGVTDFNASRQKVELKAEVQVYLYTVSMAGPEAAARELQGHLWRESGGAARGLLPALYKLAQRRIQDADGQSYLVLLGDTVLTGAVAEKDSAHSTGVAMVELQLVTMRNPPS